MKDFFTKLSIKEKGQLIYKNTGIISVYGSKEDYYKLKMMC
jgi:hypothetical protein